jgi:5,10-methylenetetrahydromethanopterin reductase
MQLGNISVLLEPESLKASELRRFAKVADTTGFHAAWTVDGSTDPSVFNQEILAHTMGIVSGTCVAARWKRHPMGMAQYTASLDHLYPGRVSVGIGSAAWVTHPRASWGEPLDRVVGRMAEFLEILQRALAGEDADVSGRYYVSQGRIALPPGHRVPVYVAAGGPQMAEMAGRKADGVYCHVGTAARIGMLAQTARSAAEKAGRDPDELRVDQVVYACVAETRDLALDELRRVIAIAVGDDQLSQAVTELRSAQTAAALVAQRAAGDVDGAAAALPDEFVDQMGVAFARSESAAYVDKALAAVRAPGVSALTLYPLPADGSDFAGSYKAFFDLFQKASPK